MRFDGDRVANDVRLVHEILRTSKFFKKRLYHYARKCECSYIMSYVLLRHDRIEWSTTEWNGMEWNRLEWGHTLSTVSYSISRVARKGLVTRKCP